jgi:hypothetical protein
MPRLYVVYDTNIYRGISQAEFDDLRRLERDNAVVGIASYSVALEMLHHMTPEDGGFDSSRAGLRKLVAHCRDYVGQYRLTFIAGLDSQIRYARFGVRRVPPEEERADISWLVGAFGPDEDDSAVERFKQVIANVRAYIDSEEESFIDAIWRVIKSEIAPDAQDWTAFHRARKPREMALADLATSDAERNFGDKDRAEAGEVSIPWLGPTPLPGHFGAASAQSLHAPLRCGESPLLRIASEDRPWRPPSWSTCPHPALHRDSAGQRARTARSAASARMRGPENGLRG